MTDTNTPDEAPPIYFPDKGTVPPTPAPPKVEGRSHE